MKKTPMMQQYDRAKEQCGDALLLFRMGDFYELFYSDAEFAAEALGLTLTSRDKNSDKAVAMAGFPHHQLDSYLGKLIKKGHRVAVCEQVEDPKTAKGLVKREISQIVSAGTVTDENLLNPTQANYLVAVVLPGKKETRFGVAWLDLSTGKFVAEQVQPANLNGLVSRLSPSEILVDEKVISDARDLMAGFKFTAQPTWAASFKHANELLLDHFSVATLEGFGFDELDVPCVRAAGAILQYVKETQNSTLGHIDLVERYRSDEVVEIDSATWRSLEISSTMRNGSQDGSLFAVINRCVTSMGARQLGQWLTSPLKDLSQLNERQGAVDEFLRKQELRKNVRGLLKQVFDLGRLVGKISSGRCLPRDLTCVANTLQILPKLKAALSERHSSMIQNLENRVDLCADLRLELERALNDPCPSQLKDGGYIRDGYSQELDELRSLAAGGKQWIAEYQQTICEQTGIPSLKVGFNKVFGYYLEVTHTHRDKVPNEFIRKQTLKNAERFITPELKEYEEKVLSADEKAQTLEQEIFVALRELVRSHASRLKKTASALAMIDVFAGLAELAARQHYVRPELTDDHELFIQNGKHPVLDVIEPTGTFIPNDTLIDDESGFVHLITGPNMAGKSTYIRQVALMTLLAQIGSFVPAKKAKIGIVDRIFARIGASDELSRGQSTFMVEMTETARILNTATNRSLVILDEIGRGTSTYDGVSLAWSIVEFIHEQIGCRTLFATHYHELTELESTFNGVKNYNVAVQEWDEKIVFLHKILRGAADRSYGIHVSKLAGVPHSVSERAQQILDRLESRKSDVEHRNNITQAAKNSGEMQLKLFEIADHPLIDEIEKLDLDRLAPLEALETIYRWKKQLEESGHQV